MQKYLKDMVNQAGERDKPMKSKLDWIISKSACLGFAKKDLRTGSTQGPEGHPKTCESRFHESELAAKLSHQHRGSMLPRDVLLAQQQDGVYNHIEPERCVDLRKEVRLLSIVALLRSIRVLSSTMLWAEGKHADLGILKLRDVECSIDLVNGRIQSL